MIANGNTYCKIASFGPILPPEYQEVEYIESDGNQYIETNVIADQDTSINIRFKLKSIANLTEASGSCVYSGAASYNNRTKEVYSNANKLSISCGNAYIYSSLTINTTDIFEIENTKNIYIVKNVNTSTSSTVEHTYTTYTTPYSIWLFALHRGNSMSSIKGKGAKIYKCSILQDTTLVRNLIPCYRKSDNVIGMYDTVNKVFYTNQGTGTFLKGNNVVHTIRYKIPTEERPYISGHVTDGSSTFTFTVNGNQSITVPVDSNGNWKWVVDRTITSLNQSFNTKLNISEVTINCLKDVTDMTQIFRAGSAETTLTKVTFNNCDFSKVTSLNSAFNNRRGLVSIKGIDSSKFELNVNLMYTFIYCYKLQFPENFKWSNIITNKTSDMRYAFADCRTIINESTYYGGTIDCSNATPTKLDCAYMNCFVDKIILPIITSTCTVTNAFDGALRLVDIEAQSISTSLDLRKCSRLNKQSIINLTNASQANVTYTLHSTVYNKCKSGGEWYTDIQAAIDAKAQQGYTVTLISA